MTKQADLSPSDTFSQRHNGPSEADVVEMLRAIGAGSLGELANQTVPDSIRLVAPLALGAPRGEHELLQELAEIMDANQLRRSYIGTGYYDCITPPVIQRNVLENPGWYTQYTPYQAEIAQGRLEALLNFQTMIADLTGLPLANASLLDEATAAAEAMSMCHAVARGKKSGFFIVDGCHPQTINVVETRAKPVGINVLRGAASDIDFGAMDLCGVLVQYPATDGRIKDHEALCRRAHDAGALVVVATDLLALTLLRPPGEFGADIAVGSSQRFGVPYGYGGPHAAFIATLDKFRRQLPGRIVGVSKDAAGRPAFRLALQTREQHIRRDRATSNICTAQVLLAVMASMYGVYHGPDGLRRIARRVRGFTNLLAAMLGKLGLDVDDGPLFDTVRVRLDDGGRQRVASAANARHINLRCYDDGFGVSLGESTTMQDVTDLVEVFARDSAPQVSVIYAAVAASADQPLPAPFARESEFMTHPIWSSHRTETALLRYLHRLQAKDLSLTTSMIPLGSCTMKLNGTSEMVPVTWPKVAGLHPFVPPEQARGYSTLFGQLETWLAEITGFAATSLQPNAGAQGEYAGLLVIRAYHEDRGQGHRNVCLIPVSAHGTNPASAVMAGFNVVAIACDDQGNVDLDDLKAKAHKHKDALGALMITYPSTHGVFESKVREICDTVHEYGGQVYLDGANLNAQIGLCRPGDYGADVCHLNLHKTFSIPHGGGGPGMGPICVAVQLAPYLPGHPMRPAGDKAIGAISAAPYGSPSILPISWVYIALMGAEGLASATQIAILNANYMAKRLESQFEILYMGTSGRVAHEFIIDMRPFKKSAGIEVDDVAKRLMDYGFHAPTMSFPVPGTLMIEPTESESKQELDRFCDAMLSIREEIRAIEDGEMDRENNPLKNAPHTALDVTTAEWNRPYTRQEAAFPARWSREHKFWPAVARIDNTYGDRNLVCTCPPMTAFADES